MGTVSKAYTETWTDTSFTSTKATHTLSFTKDDVNVSGNTFQIGTLNCTFKYNTSVGNRNTLDDLIKISTSFSGQGSYTGQFWTKIVSLSANTPYSLTYNYTETYNTTDFFNSNNPTTRSIPIKIYAERYWLQTLYTRGEGYTSEVVGHIISSQYSQGVNVHEEIGDVCNIVLNAPPTFDVSAISYDTNYVYAGLTTASVTVSNATAQYGGTVSSATLTIGNQTASISGNGTISVLLNAGGNFTPTVTVTDSRGQTTTKTLNQISVNFYAPPSVSFGVIRTTSSGVADDDGSYVIMSATFKYTDVVATLSEPTVTVTDENGIATTPTVVWYEDRSLTTAVDWSDTSNYTSPITLYGFANTFNPNYSYQISIAPIDSEGTGTAITQTLGSAFYTVDFLAGGHGIAFGQPASATGFECAMPTTFKNTVAVGGALSCNNDVLIDLPNYQTSGTTDYDIYTAIVTLGWDSEVIV